MIVLMTKMHCPGRLGHDVDKIPCGEDSDDDGRQQ